MPNCRSTARTCSISFEPVSSKTFITGMDWWVLKHQASPSPGHQEDFDLVFPTTVGGRGCGPCPIREETLLQVCWVEVRADMRSLKFTIAFLHSFHSYHSQSNLTGKKKSVFRFLQTWPHYIYCIYYCAYCVLFARK